MKVSFRIKEVQPRVFLFEFKSHYDLCITFLRYQECYESPNPKFRGKVFSILDFMEWYSKKDGKDTFNYMQDWAGFNLPAPIIPFIYNSKELRDPNDYDFAMYQAYLKCKTKYKDGNFYIIGAQKGQAITLRHEVAHGFFFTTPEYKKEMTALVKALDPKLKKEIFIALKGLGYTPKVYIDECQAYLATSTTKDARHYFKSLKNENKPFIKVYQKYCKK